MNNIIITIDQGKLRGKVVEDEQGNFYRSFQGIPYAKPPLGKLRFKAPEPAEPWFEEIYDATKQKSPCYAKDLLLRKVIGSEDCLYLNVYTPMVQNSNEKFPVMFWSYPGGFTRGSSNADLYGPEYLVAKNIVLVTFNYRLGYLGFLKLKDPSLGVTGNAALKDHVEALRWTQKNISSFGGDPDNVTIFGTSSGGVSVNLLQLSPLAKGLFHKVIIQNACVKNPFNFEASREYDFVKELGCFSTNDAEILDFLQKCDYKLFRDIQQKLLTESDLCVGESCLVSPTVEPNVPGAFLTESPNVLMARGDFIDVPMIIGTNTDDGMLMCDPRIIKSVTPDFTDDSRLVPRDLKNLLQNKSAIDAVGKLIKQYYYCSSRASKDPMKNYIKFYTDVMFGYHMHLITIEFAQKCRSPVYNYVCSLNTKMNLMKLLFKIEYEGCSHNDEMSYLFKCKHAPRLIAETPEANGVHVMTTLWTNFAKTGNPNPKSRDPLIPVTWKPYTVDEKFYLKIGNTVTADNEPEKDTLEFWNTLYAEARKGRNIYDNLKTSKL